MKRINVISVCGSGTVTSSMVAGKVKDFLEDNGYKAKTVEVNPGGVENELASGQWDVIVHTSPLKGTYSIPTINSVGLLTGMEEEEFYEELLETVKSL
ncbi:PTS sugar transporter subunit IIB [Enterococcus sp. BWT-B8]|uniref:PTS sugar transporter subunit IIB n=1 Tax=Enterococcus sp. BWT-B8 TaxID=2885157 RepID=UPI001E30AF52|nr:PTS sugar transporter subunit IIB [Enterococcus sp. BWT-B8]MCB5950476.1 PTS sugar transporter subunit IIB [Enterococcus sp. BWT-B8]